MKQLLWAGVALSFCAGSLCAGAALAQSVPISTPSSPPVTTPPPPGVNPPTGGPNSMPTAEPANAIDSHGVTPGANSFTAAQAKSRLAQNGYSEVADLTKGGDGIWHATASKNGARVHVQLDYKGNVSTD